MGVVELLKEIEVKAQEGQMGIAGELQAKYDEGFAAGEAVGFVKGQESIVLPDPSNPDKIYTQADMDLAVTNNVNQKASEMQAIIDGKDGELASAKAELESLKADLDARVVAGALERVDKVKAAAKVELDEAEKAIENL